MKFLRLTLLFACCSLIIGCRAGDAPMPAEQSGSEPFPPPGAAYATCPGCGEIVCMKCCANCKKTAWTLVYGGMLCSACGVPNQGTCPKCGTIINSYSGLWKVKEYPASEGPQQFVPPAKADLRDIELTKAINPAFVAEVHNKWVRFQARFHSVGELVPLSSEFQRGYVQLILYPPNGMAMTIGIIQKDKSDVVFHLGAGELVDVTAYAVPLTQDASQPGPIANVVFVIDTIAPKGR